MLIQVWHPDRFGHSHSLRSRAELNTKLLNAAYEHLRSHLDPSFSVAEHLAVMRENPNQSSARDGESTKARTDERRPSEADIILPFQLSSKGAAQALDDFIVSGEYTTESFIRDVEIIRIIPSYLPAYMFSLRFVANWTASFGFDHMETYTEYRKRYDSDLNGMSRSLSQGQKW